jgi:predicted Zn finger-like uncharacterized protein
MYIVCPHCTTSYAIDPAALGVAGRNVRCSRCKEVWLARPEDAVENLAPARAMASAGQASSEADAAAEWEAMAAEDDSLEAPVVDSPSISADWPDGDGSPPSADSDWAAAQDDAAMGALVLALMIWRVDVVRLLPQTATFYKMVGFEVNLRGLMFKDVKISTETVEGKRVLVIEGVITGEARKPVELPRLRFSVRDAQGAEIYAWNTVLEQTVLRPGERASFKSRLASPPPEGRNIDIRFFNRRDMASGSA